MTLTSVSSSGCYASLPSLLYPRSSECSDWWGSGEKNRFLMGGREVSMKCCFINSSGAKNLESRLVAIRLMAKRLAGSSCCDRVGQGFESDSVKGRGA